MGSLRGRNINLYKILVWHSGLLNGYCFLAWYLVMHRDNFIMYKNWIFGK